MEFGEGAQLVSFVQSSTLFSYLKAVIILLKCTESQAYFFRCFHPGPAVLPLPGELVGNAESQASVRPTEPDLHFNKIRRGLSYSMKIGESFGFSLTCREW